METGESKRPFEIIKKLLFEDRCVKDVCTSMNLTLFDVRSEIQTMRKILIRYI